MEHPLNSEPKRAGALDLDALLTPDECARWLKISRRKLMENARAGLIPAVRVNERVIRFHPRTILQRLGGMLTK